MRVAHFLSRAGVGLSACLLGFACILWVISYCTTLQVVRVWDNFRERGYEDCVVSDQGRVIIVNIRASGWRAYANEGWHCNWGSLPDASGGPEWLLCCLEGFGPSTTTRPSGNPQAYMLLQRPGRVAARWTTTADVEIVGARLLIQRPVDPQILSRYSQRGVIALVVLPYWILVLLFSLPCVGWLLLRVRKRLQVRRRIAAGLCPHCGYDLRGSSQRCPECGTAYPQSPVETGDCPVVSIA
jgi:hypothetical protein